MAKGGNNQRSNGSRLTKPYNVSNVSIHKMQQGSRETLKIDRGQWLSFFNDLLCAEFCLVKSSIVYLILIAFQVCLKNV